MSEVNSNLYAGIGVAVGTMMGLGIVASNSAEVTEIERCQAAVYEYEDMDSLTNFCGDLILSDTLQTYTIQNQTIIPGNVNIETARVVVDHAEDREKSRGRILGFLTTIGFGISGGGIGFAAGSLRDMGKEQKIRNKKIAEHKASLDRARLEEGFTPSGK